jgi:hypothetical protein
MLQLAPMSFHFYLYRGPDGLPPVTQWPSMLAQPLGAPERVRGALAGLLLNLEWIGDQGSRAFGKAVDPYYKCNFYVHIHEDDAGSAALISLSSSASPRTLATVMDHLSLNYCCSSLGDLRYPHDCDDHWNRLGSGR